MFYDYQLIGNRLHAKHWTNNTINDACPGHGSKLTENLSLIDDIYPLDTSRNTNLSNRNTKQNDLLRSVYTFFTNLKSGGTFRIRIRKK